MHSAARSTKPEIGWSVEMSSGSSPAFVVRQSHVASDRAADIWRFYWSDLRNNLVATFLIVAFMMTGMAWIFLAIFGSLEHTSLSAMGIGSCFGLLASLWLLSKEFRYYKLLRKDLRMQKCEVIEAAPKIALAIDLPNDLPALAFDCGLYTLLVIGDWWKPHRRPDISWTNTAARRSFPTSRFSIYRLPRTGRVFSVNASGTMLKTHRDQPMEPQLQIDISNFVDCYYVEQELSTLRLRKFDRCNLLDSAP